MNFLKKLFRKTSNATEHINNDILFNTHRNSIYPWIKVIIKDDEPDTGGPVFELGIEDTPPTKHWLGDLMIFYAADTGSHFTILQKRHLPQDISIDELHQLAVENLQRDLTYTLHDTSFGGYMLTAGGNHEAGAICLPGVWDWVLEHLNDNLIIAIPTKDLVLIAEECKTDVTANLKIFVHEIFKKDTRHLTRNIFRLDKTSKKWEIIEKVN